MLFLTIVQSLALTAPAPTRLAQVPENRLSESENVWNALLGMDPFELYQKCEEEFDLYFSIQSEEIISLKLDLEHSENDAAFYKKLHRELLYEKIAEQEVFLKKIGQLHEYQESN